MHGHGNQCNQDTEEENFLKEAKTTHTDDEEETKGERERRDEKKVKREGDHRETRKNGFRRFFKKKLASFMHNGFFGLKKQKASNVNGD